MLTVEIRLTDAELAIAAQVGLMRNLTSIRDGNKPQHGANEKNLWSIHVEGACGECVVARHLNVYWSHHVGRFRGQPDLIDHDGTHIEVRTASRDDGPLTIRPRDNQNQKFVLVTGLAPNFTIRGWLWGYCGVLEQYVSDSQTRGRRWFVPQKDLRPIDTFRSDDDPAPLQF